jgi:hypothetical protein
MHVPANSPDRLVAQNGKSAGSRPWLAQEPVGRAPNPPISAKFCQSRSKTRQRYRNADARFLGLKNDENC